MIVRLHIYMRIYCIYVHIYVHTHTHIYMHIYTYIYIFIFIFLYEGRQIGVTMNLSGGSFPPHVPCTHGLLQADSQSQGRGLSEDVVILFLNKWSEKCLCFFFGHICLLKKAWIKAFLSLNKSRFFFFCFLTFQQNQHFEERSWNDPAWGGGFSWVKKIWSQTAVSGVWSQETLSGVLL